MTERLHARACVLVRSLAHQRGGTFGRGERLCEARAMCQLYTAATDASAG